MHYCLQSKPTMIQCCAKFGPHDSKNHRLLDSHWPFAHTKMLRVCATFCLQYPRGGREELTLFPQAFMFEPHSCSHAIRLHSLSGDKMSYVNALALTVKAHYDPMLCVVLRFAPMIAKVTTGCLILIGCSKVSLNLNACIKANT